MLTSLAWLNACLQPATVTADEAEHVLTHVGFPIESRETVAVGSGTDVKLDVELTSNRGDCLSHIGLAREIAAATGRTLHLPSLGQHKPSGSPASGALRVENHLATPSAPNSSIGCPRFTARVFKNVRVGPSPAWLRDRLEAVGLRPINNVVDITNYINLELGHPCHVFDLDTLAGKALVVRLAHKGEKVVALDGREHTLRETDMVVADADKAVSIAGVIGGLHTGVTERTTSVVFEMATWDPAMVRRAARRLDIRTDASHRFERVVDARDIDFASARVADLIVELAGATMLDGVIDVGAPRKPEHRVTLRAARCEHILGIRVETDQIVRLLSAVGFRAEPAMEQGAQVVRCAVPPHRHDVTREIDLIEEVARLNGLDKIHVAPALDVHLQLAHPETWAKREKAMALLGQTLASHGFFETVTVSFVTKEHAAMFCPPGLRLLSVDPDRRRENPYLRPSIIPSLLTCRRANQDGQVRTQRGVRLFETAAVFAEEDDGKVYARKTVERRSLALLADVPAGLKPAEAKQAGVREMRGVIESLARALGGDAANVAFEQREAPFAALAGETFAAISVNGKPVGTMTTISAKAQAAWGLDVPVVAAELSLEALIALYPPRALVRELPKYPAIERDLSLVVDEQTAWARCEAAVRAVAPAHWLEGLEFVGAYRGKPLDAGKKSLTMRLAFRDPSRTLRNEELDEPMTRVMDAARKDLGAQIRGVDVQ